VAAVRVFLPEKVAREVNRAMIVIRYIVRGITIIYHCDRFINLVATEIMIGEMKKAGGMSLRL
jgi:hypothetical protein